MAIAQPQTPVSAKVGFEVGAEVGGEEVAVKRKWECPGKRKQSVPGKRKWKRSKNWMPLLLFQQTESISQERR